MSQSEAETPGGDTAPAESNETGEYTPERSITDAEPPIAPRTAGIAITGLGGLLSAVAGLRALRRGDRALGFARLGLGAVLGAIALALRRSRASQEPGPGASPREAEPQVPEESAADERETAEGDGTATASAEPATETSGEGIERDGEADESVEYERLGGAAFDEYASEVPAPQQAFNIELLELSAEAFWGVREADDAVLVSHEFDALQDADGVRYVGSSEIDGDRMLSIPDVVRNHWSDSAGGGTVVESGTKLTFATNDDLRADGQILLVPEHDVETILGEES